MNSILPSLDAIQARADERETQRQRFDSHRRDIAAHESAADVPALVEVVRDVLALHEPTDESMDALGTRACYECSDPEAPLLVTYPCPTVRAVTAHIDTTPKETDR